MAEPKANDYEGDYEGTCRACWKVRNMGPGWLPKANPITYWCNRTNPDGSICDGRLLIALTTAARRRVALARRQKKAQEFQKK